MCHHVFNTYVSDSRFSSCKFKYPQYVVIFKLLTTLGLQKLLLFLYIYTTQVILCCLKNMVKIFVSSAHLILCFVLLSAYDMFQLFLNSKFCSPFTGLSKF